MINKNISVWRGNSTPPTNYHLWVNNNKEVKIFINNLWESVVSSNVGDIQQTLEDIQKECEDTKANLEDIQQEWDVTKNDLQNTKTEFNDSITSLSLLLSTNRTAIQQNTSAINQINLLLQTVLSNIDYLFECILENVTCEDLENKTTIKLSGGTFTITPKLGYELDTHYELEGLAEVSIDLNVLTISNVQSNIKITVKGKELIPNTISICDVNGTSLTSLTVQGEDTIKVIVTSNSKPVLSKYSKYKFSSIPSGCTLSKGSLIINTNTELTSGDIIKIKVTQTSTVQLNLSVITQAPNLTVQKLETIKVVLLDGVVKGIKSITPSSWTFDLYVGGTQEFTATLNHTLITTPTEGYTWSLDGSSIFSIDDSKTNKVEVKADSHKRELQIGTLTVKYGEHTKSVTLTSPQYKMYYWYVGTENPINVKELTDKDMATTTTSMGWRLIGEELPIYNSGTKLWDGTTNEIKFNEDYVETTAYLALPRRNPKLTSDIKVYDSFNTDVTGDLILLEEKCTIYGITYDIYKNNLDSNCLTYSLNLFLY